MSATCDIVCKTCKVGLWIGQTSWRKSSWGIYSAPEHIEKLEEFLSAHDSSGEVKHELYFGEDQNIEMFVDYEPIEDAPCDKQKIQSDKVSDDHAKLKN